MGNIVAELARKEGRTYEPAEVLLGRILDERHARWEASKRRGKYGQPKAPDKSDLPLLPEGWTWARWEQVGFSQNGRSFPSSEYTDVGTRLLRPGNLHVSGRVVWNEDNTRCMPDKWANDFPAFLIGGGEMVMNLTAQSLKDEFLGRICITDAQERCLLNQRIARLTPVFVEPRYLLWMFKSRVFRSFVDSLNTGSLIEHMFTSQLDDFVLPLPPLAEQHRIVAEVDRLLSIADETEAAVRAQLARAERLRQSFWHAPSRASSSPRTRATSPRASCWSGSGRRGRPAREETGGRLRARDALESGGRPGKEDRPMNEHTLFDRPAEARK
jgi:type I restriction enzyme S subunit